MTETLRYLVEALRVRRCHAEPVLHAPSVGEHSCGVAVLCLLLAPHCSKQLLVAAVTHDLGERRWGDVPGNVKAELDLGARFDQLEQRTVEEQGLPVPAQLLAGEQRTLEVADKLDLLLHCGIERAQGNRLIQRMWANCRNALQGYAPFNPTEAALVRAADLLYEEAL